MDVNKMSWADWDMLYTQINPGNDNEVIEGDRAKAEATVRLLRCTLERQQRTIEAYREILKQEFSR